MLRRRRHSDNVLCCLENIERKVQGGFQGGDVEQLSDLTKEGIVCFRNPRGKCITSEVPGGSSLQSWVSSAGLLTQREIFWPAFSLS